jgi:Tfp pilus assembly protein PilX
MKKFKRQEGATLITSLIMLIVLTLLVISAIRSSTTNLRIAGNMQMQAEAIAVAQLATEQVISYNFTESPNASTVSYNVDINNDGNPDYDVRVTTPTCIKSLPILNSSLNPDSTADKSCISSATQKGGNIIYTSSTTATSSMQSWCASQQWDIPAVASSVDGAVSVKTHQGVSLKVGKEVTCKS